ncbi:uncharacterized protein LOC114515627 isoform X1 [Dendronephthya gigantea]|uniref:uncharacterized protein LOC114515627 isoform X1 n=1 Tax=Dendronephthya gigantea TaxID=151771 RepID=UPI0010696B6E|nr:uncharacterized protein LOC114515627 isoform X1 [Dendronephthya gigantea]
MNMFANRQKYTMDEICGFGYLHDEFRHWITFWLGGCDGTTKSERITETNSKYTHVMPGNQAVVQWAWCVAVNSTITNISIYKVTRFKSRTTNHMVLSIDVLEKVNYARDNSKHELFSVKKKARFQARAIFVINNVSEADDGEYSIRIRRIGYRDLHNEVKIFVNPREPAAQKPATTITNNPEPSAHTLATIITNTPAIKGRKSESLSPLYIGLIVAGAIIVFFGLLICYKCRRAHCPLLTRWWERFRIYMGCCFLLS